MQIFVEAMRNKNVNFVTNLLSNTNEGQIETAQSEPLRGNFCITFPVNFWQKYGNDYTKNFGSPL